MPSRAPRVPYAELSTRTQVAHMRAAALKVLERYPISVASIRLVSHEFNTTFRVDDADGRRFALRINVNSRRSLEQVAAETAWVEALAHVDHVHVPELQRTADGAPFVVHEHQRLGRQVPAVLYSWLPGSDVGRTPPAGRLREIGRLTARLHDHASSWELPDGASLERLDRTLLDVEDRLAEDHAVLSDDVREVLFEVRSRADAAFARLRRRHRRIVLHADLHGWNIKRDRDRLRVFDFDDTGSGLPVQDLAISTYYFREVPDAHVALLEGYAEVRAAPDIDDSDFETLVASRNLLLLNELLVAETAEHRAMLEAYVARSTVKLRDFLDEGRYRHDPPGLPPP